MRIEDHRLSFLTAHLVVSIFEFYERKTASFIFDHESMDTVSVCYVGERVSILKIPAFCVFSESGRFISTIDLFWWVFSGILFPGGECPTIQSQNCTKIHRFSEGNASSEETSCKSNCDLQKLRQVSFALKSNQMEIVGNRYPFEKMCAVVKISDLSRIWGFLLSFNTGNSSRFTSRHSTCWSFLYLSPPLWG